MGLFVCFYFFSKRAHLNIFVFAVNLLDHRDILETNVVMSGFFFSLSVASSELCWGIRNYSWTCTQKGHPPPFPVILKKGTKNCPTVSFCLYYTTRIAIPMVNWAFFKLYKMLTPLIKYTPMESFKRNIHTKNTLIYRQGKIFRQIRLLI